MKWLVLALVVLSFNACRSPEEMGIHAVPNWPHGVLICGEGFTINEGHQNDPQVKQLFKLASKCK